MARRFVKVAAAEEVRPGKMTCVEIEGHPVLVANVDGNYYAVDDTCTHEDASLSAGALQGEFVKCPLHGSRFNVRTGEVQVEPAEEDLKTYTVKIEGNDLLIGWPSGRRS